MKVFVAGATGVMGRQLVPRLLEAGHQVIGMTRTESKREELWDLGARPIVADALDPDQVAEAVGEAQPDVIVHELTAIGTFDPRHFDRTFALTNRLRTEGTDHLLSAGHAVGVRRFVAQSYAAWPYARTGGPIKTEDDPLDSTPARQMRQSLAAIRHLEEAVLGADWTEGIVLRYGAFYGPGTSMSPGSEQLEMVRKRKFPLVGDGGGLWSFVHMADAAEATLDLDRLIALARPPRLAEPVQTEPPASNTRTVRVALARDPASCFYYEDNLDLLREVCAATPAPVIASGGVSTLDDLRALAPLESVGVEGVIAGKALYEKKFTIAEGQAALDHP